MLDNCIIHRQQRVIEAVHAKGGIVLFLEAYDPESMPVEFAYKCMKNWYRQNAKGLPDEMSIASKLRMAMRAVGPSSSRHAFHAAGCYTVKPYGDDDDDDEY